MMTPYITLLVSVIHPVYGMTINRYCIGISPDDSRMQGFELDHWAEPENRSLLLSLLCEDWLTDGCSIVDCTPIAGSIQWEMV